VDRWGPRPHNLNVVNMEILDIVIAGFIICLAGMAQSAVGFGYALYATPLLVWIGIPLPSVITLVATCSMIQSIISARKLHTMVPWRLSLTATAIRLASVIIGLFLLKRLVVLNGDLNRSRQCIGAGQDLPSLPAASWRGYVVWVARPWSYGRWRMTGQHKKFEVSCSLCLPHPSRSKLFYGV